MSEFIKPGNFGFRGGLAPILLGTPEQLWSGRERKILDAIGFDGDSVTLFRRGILDHSSGAYITRRQGEGELEWRHGRFTALGEDSWIGTGGVTGRSLGHVLDYGWHEEAMPTLLVLEAQKEYIINASSASATGTNIVAGEITVKATALQVVDIVPFSQLEKYRYAYADLSDVEKRMVGRIKEWRGVEWILQGNMRPPEMGKKQMEALGKIE